MLFVLVGSFLVPCVQAQTMPQTARQAVIEMFFSKTPGTFEKHLPDVTKAALHKARENSGGPSMLDGFSLITSQMQAHGQGFETFDAGPILVAVDNPQEQSRLEVRVERDDLRGDEDRIELSFRAYKAGQLQTAGVDPRFTLAMKQESGVWKMQDLTFAIRISLTDPNLLKAMTTAVHAPMVTANTTEPSAMPATYGVTRAANETSAVASVRALLTAETSYAAAYPTHGFTCTLSDLGGMGSGNAMDEHHAMLVDPRLANGRKSGYVFKMSGCDGPPAAHFTVTAAPADATAGTRVYCSDESAVVRFTEGGNAGSCGSSAKPLQ
jgi:type IV pilus assembly protein PilA